MKSCVRSGASIGSSVEPGSAGHQSGWDGDEDGSLVPIPGRMPARSVVRWEWFAHSAFRIIRRRRNSWFRGRSRASVEKDPATATRSEHGPSGPAAVPQRYRKLRPSVAMSSGCRNRTRTWQTVAAPAPLHRTSRMPRTCFQCTGFALTSNTNRSRRVSGKNERR